MHNRHPVPMLLHSIDAGLVFHSNSLQVFQGKMHARDWDFPGRRQKPRPENRTGRRCLLIEGNHLWHSRGRHATTPLCLQLIFDGKTEACRPSQDGISDQVSGDPFCASSKHIVNLPKHFLASRVHECSSATRRTTGRRCPLSKTSWCSWT